MEDLNKKTFKELGVDWIGIELTNTCNIKCTYCPISYRELERSLSEKVMPYELVEKIVSEIGEDGTLDFVILNYYGEPFLHPKFEDVLQLCEKKKIKIRFGTNGTLFNNENIRLIRKYEPDELVISIQYFMRENYEKVKGTNIDYDQWLNQIAHFLEVMINEEAKTKIQLAIACNYDNGLRNKILGLRHGDKNLPFPNNSYFIKLDNFIKEFCEERLHVLYNPKPVNGIKEKRTYNKYYSINKNISFELKTFFDSTNFYYFKENKQVNCFMPYLNVNSKGEVVMCCADYIGGTSIGNMKGRKIKEILIENYAVFLNKMNEKSKIELCRKCYGERTYRGLLLKKSINYLRRVKMKHTGQNTEN
jgi:organic radical activating enzyme